MRLKASVLSVFVGVVVATQAFAYQYTVKDIGALGGVIQGSTYSQPTAVNNLGDVVGVSYVTSRTPHGFLFSNEVMTDLTPSANSYASALGINDSSVVVGQFNSHPYIYLNGNLQTLSFAGTATGIDSDNHVVGTNFQTHRAFLYANGSIQDLGTLGGFASEANGVSSSGIIVGESFLIGDSSIDAFIYSNGRMQALNIGTINNQGIYAKAVNNAGQVVGQVGANAFLYENGSLIDLGILGSSLSMAESINNHGQVVGWNVKNVNGSPSAFIYENGQLHDLSTVLLANGWTDTQATAINDNGQIVGIGSMNGQTHGFIMIPTTAVPEPATYTLIVAGLGLMGFAIMKKTKSLHA